MTETSTIGLTDDERAVIRMTGDLYKAMAALPQFHTSDLDEAAFHIHALGRIVGMRAAHRAHPDMFPTLAGVAI